MNDVLYLITARSGSKGLKDKNIKELNGIPLLAIRGLSVLQISDKKHIWLSTDSKKYAKLGAKYGMTIPFIRPKHLGGDNVSSSDVVLHAMKFANKLGRNYKYIVLLEPTSPLVYLDDMKSALDLLESDNMATAIIATKEVETNSFFIQPQAKYLDVLANRMANSMGHRRQDRAMDITPCGGFYIAKWDNFIKEQTFYTSKTLSYQLPNECALEIDNNLQFHWAQFLVREKIVDFKKICLYDGSL